MLIALIADIHANNLALEACLARVKNLNASRIVFLGDLVGYGAEPERVVRTVARLAGTGAVVVMGNHDCAIGDPSVRMNAIATRAIEWTREQLSSESKAFLAAMPMAVTEDDRLYVHADALNPAEWNYVISSDDARCSLEAASAGITFCGHVHVPQLFCLSATGKLIGHLPATGVATPLGEQRRWLAVIGSAGQPRDGNPAAAFAIYDKGNRTITYLRAAYDVELAAQKVRAAGLPEALAARLLRGT